MLDERLRTFCDSQQKLDDLDHNDQQFGEAITGCNKGRTAGLKSPFPGFSTPAPAPETLSPKASAPVAAGGNWQQAILGPELTAQPGLEPHRQRLFDGMLSGEPAACALAGQLLLFQSAALGTNGAPVERHRRGLLSLAAQVRAGHVADGNGPGPMAQAAPRADRHCQPNRVGQSRRAIRCPAASRHRPRRGNYRSSRLGGAA